MTLITTLVVTKIRARLSSVTGSRRERTMRLNIQRLLAEGAGEEYAHKLDELIEERLSGDNLNAVWQTVYEEISTTATEV